MSITRVLKRDWSVRVRAGDATTEAEARVMGLYVKK